MKGMRSQTETYLSSLINNYVYLTGYVKSHSTFEAVFIYAHASHNARSE